ncbi:MAG: autotransporter-associated beta strand repeat-containing protein [Thermoguttaceae bacterium]|jgi:autotransporter-associated beta strand protein
MKPTPRLILGIAIWCLPWTLQFARAQSDPLGYSALLTDFGKAHLQAPGTGVVVEQVEAPVNTNGGTNLYMPDRTLTQFSSVTINDETAITSGTPGAVSWHADNVAGLLYGTYGFAPGVSQVDVYEANDWLNNGLKVGSGSAPASAPANNPGVANFSWVGTYGDPTSDADALRRLDYLIDRDNLVAVVAVNNSNTPTGTPVPALLASSYNAIAVGLTGINNDYSSVGPTTAGDVPGRSKPDIVAPQNATSYATPEVSAAAAMLLQVAGSDNYTQADNPAVIKAILMAGTDKNAVSTWMRTFTQPLDPQYGAGQLNFDRAYQILTAGPQTASSTSLVGSTGWSSDAIGPSGGAKDYFFQVASGQPLDLSAVLTWERAISFSASVSGSATLTPSLATIDLNLYQANSNYTLGTLVDQSVSTIDNVQDLFQRTLPPGEYALQVMRTDSIPGSWNYALAWQLQSSTVIPVWNGGGGSGNSKWSLGANWAANGSGGTPTAPGLLTFGALAASNSSNVSTNDFAANTQFNGITFRSDASAYSLVGNAIQLGGAVTNQSSNDQSIGFAIQIVSGGGLFDTGGQTITLWGNVSGAGQGILKQGAGTLVLGGNNTYSGGTTIDGGTLQVGNGTTAGSLPATGSVVDNATLAFNRSDAVTLGNAISGTGGLVQLGPGRLILGGSNTYAGMTTVSAGTLALDYTTNNNSKIGAGLSLGPATVLQLAGNGASPFTQNVGGLTLSGGAATIDASALGQLSLSVGTITRSNNATVNFVFPAAGTSAITASTSPGRWATAGNDFAKVAGGVVTAMSAADYTALGGTSGAPTITAGTAAIDAVTSATTGPVTLPATGTIDIDSLMINDATARTVDVRNGTTQGTLRFAAAGGLLASGGAHAIGIAGNAGTITAGGAAGAAGELIVTNQSTTNSLTINSAIANNGSGPVTLTKSGPGIAVLTNTANTYTGGTIVDGGILQITRTDWTPTANVSAALPGGAITLAGGTAMFNFFDRGLSNNITLTANSTINIPSGSGQQTNLSGTISGAGETLTKDGPGTLYINTSNVTLGAINVLAGSLVADGNNGGGANWGGSGTTVTVANGGSLITRNNITLPNPVVLNGGTALAIDSSNGGAATYSGSVTLNAATGMDATNGAMTFTGPISGSGGLVATSSGDSTITLSGSNQYSGGTTIDGGTLQFTNPLALPGSGSIEFAGGSLVLNFGGGGGSVLAADSSLVANSEPAPATFTVSPPPQAADTPEPGTLALMAAAGLLAGMSCLWRRFHAATR